MTAGRAGRNLAEAPKLVSEGLPFDPDPPLPSSTPVLHLSALDRESSKPCRQHSLVLAHAAALGDIVTPHQLDMS